MQLSHHSSISSFVLPIHIFFFFNDTATTEIYTLSLHDALPIYGDAVACVAWRPDIPVAYAPVADLAVDRKSTRLNSSHTVISYAVFCLKKKRSTVADQPQDVNQHSNTASPSPTAATCTAVARQR